jgi:hypothetical protein
MNGSQRVEGWPELAIVEHYVPQEEMRAQCAASAGSGTVLACSKFDFRDSRCDVWLNADSWLNRFLVGHERRHCQGYDHLGDNYMEAQLARHRRTQGGG